MREFNALALIKFTTLMVLSNTSLNEDCSVFAAKASLWMLLCVKTTFGAIDYIRVTTPPRLCHRASTV